MNDTKYIGLDVHQATISAVVLDWTGKLVMECVLETKAATILQFIHGLRGSLHVTFEEGTYAAWPATSGSFSLGQRTSLSAARSRWHLVREVP